MDEGVGVWRGRNDGGDYVCARGRGAEDERRWGWEGRVQGGDEIPLAGRSSLLHFVGNLLNSSRQNLNSSLVRFHNSHGQELRDLCV